MNDVPCGVKRNFICEYIDSQQSMQELNVDDLKQLITSRNDVGKAKLKIILKG